jgi:hypothetical protein
MHLTEILERELAKFGARNLSVVETGTIRGDAEASRIGDGWSTLWFAERNRFEGTPAQVISIDLVTHVADKVLEQHGVRDRVILVEDHSIAALARLERASFDVVFLDSDNDAQLIKHEFLIALALVKPGGVILIDDCAFVEKPPTGALKGELVIPYLKDTQMPYRQIEREGWRGYKTGVLVIER